MLAKFLETRFQDDIRYSPAINLSHNSRTYMSREVDDLVHIEISERIVFCSQREFNRVVNEKVKMFDEWAIADSALRALANA